MSNQNTTSTVPAFRARDCGSAGDGIGGIGASSSASVSKSDSGSNDDARLTRSVALMSGNTAVSSSGSADACAVSLSRRSWSAMQAW